MIHLSPDISLGAILGQSMGAGLAKGYSQGRDKDLLAQVMAQSQSPEYQALPLEQQLMQAQQMMANASPEMQQSALSAIMGGSKSRQEMELQRSRQQNDLEIQRMRQQGDVDLEKMRGEREERNLRLKDEMAQAKEERERKAKELRDEVYNDVISSDEFYTMNPKDIYKYVMEVGKDRGITKEDAMNLSKQAHAYAKQQKMDMKDLIQSYDRDIASQRAMINSVSGSVDPETRKQVPEMMKQLERTISERNRHYARYRGMLAKDDPEYDENTISITEGGQTAKDVYDMAYKKFGDYDKLSAEKKKEFEEFLAKYGFHIPDELKGGKKAPESAKAPEAKPTTAPRPEPDSMDMTILRGRSQKPGNVLRGNDPML